VDTILTVRVCSALSSTFGGAGGGRTHDLTDYESPSSLVRSRRPGHSPARVAHSSEPAAAFGICSWTSPWTDESTEDDSRASSDQRDKFTSPLLWRSAQTSAPSRSTRLTSPPSAAGLVDPIRPHRSRIGHACDRVSVQHGSSRAAPVACHRSLHRRLATHSPPRQRQTTTT
jgi:hypothetical protein